jgi:hypothetical protein
MSLTGIGPKEFFDGWSIAPVGVRIPGTKPEARDRMVPLVLGKRFSGANNRREARVGLAGAEVRRCAEGRERRTRTALRSPPHLRQLARGRRHALIGCAARKRSISTRSVSRASLSMPKERKTIRDETQDNTSRPGQLHQ